MLLVIVISWAVAVSSQACLELASCPGDEVVAKSCLQRLGASLVWDPSAWDSCAAEALLNLAHKLQRSHGRDDVGPRYVGLLLAQARSKCEGASVVIPDLKRRVCEGPSWAEIEEVFPPSSEGKQSLYAQFKDGGLKFGQLKMRFLRDALSMDPNQDKTDILTVGIQSFLNEPYFGPSFALPSRNLTVTTMQFRNERFASSVVHQVDFPRSLSMLIEIGAAFLRDAIGVLRARWIVGADSAAVLLLSKLGARTLALKKLTNLDMWVHDALARSMPPAEYPPPSLSKLTPGMDAFAPPRKVFEDDDGYKYIHVNMERYSEAAHSIGVFVIAKREYTEGAQGVEVALSKTLPFLPKVFPRQEGIGLYDLDLRVRLFVEKYVMQLNADQPKIVVMRFFSFKGRFLSGHIDRVVLHSKKGAQGFCTIRNAEIETKSAEFVKMINYTGFGTLKWIESDNRHWLIDFNPRMERHTCINAALISLSSPQASVEPCAIFQRVVQEQALNETELPYIISAGVCFYEPMRILNLGLTQAGAQMAHLLWTNQYALNMHQGDQKYYDVVMGEAYQFLDNLEKMIPGFVRGNKNEL